MVLKIISGQFIDLNQTERLNNNNNNINNIIPNNTNVPLIPLIDSNVNLNPFKELAESELEEKNGPNEFEQFGELALEEMNCCICLDLLKDAVEASCCSGLFCSECSNQTIQQRGQNCPLCRANNAKFTVNEPIRRLIRRKRIKCTNEKCPDWSTLRDIEKHRAQCEFELVKCAFHGCNIELVRKIMKDHEPECGLRTVGCRHCKKEFKFAKIEQHESQCNHRPVTCQKCEKSVLFNALKSHNDDSCEMALVPCRLKCDSVILRKNMIDRAAKSCPNRQMVCQLNGCSQLVVYKNLAKHRETECVGQTILCPIGCKLKILRRDIKEHEGACMNMKIPCPHKVHGCKLMFTRKHTKVIQKHLVECQYRTVTCPDGCGQKIKILLLNAHKCDYTRHKCPDCEKIVIKKNIDTHSNQCDMRKMHCLDCREVFQWSEMAGHVKNCAYGFDTCQQCDKKVQRNKLDSHNRFSCPNRTVQCDNCDAPSFYPSKQQQHKLACTGRIVLCVHCAGPFKASQIESHERSCTERMVTCSACGQRTTSKSFILYHLPCPDELVKCNICEGTITRQYLAGHEAKCEAQNSNVKECTIQ